MRYQILSVEYFYAAQRTRDRGIIVLHAYAFPTGVLTLKRPKKRENKKTLKKAAKISYEQSPRVSFPLTWTFYSVQMHARGMLSFSLLHSIFLYSASLAHASREQARSRVCTS